jgi:pimeloyl-ACP methyl ester carboxylesterase
VVQLLKEFGHKAIAPDLAGHGADKTSTPRITLQGYVDRVREVLDAQAELVILVGHSHGGVITQAVRCSTLSGLRSRTRKCQRNN